MNNANIDVAVLLIFFNRPEKIKKVFDAVREARPTRLYLYQDGARSGRADDILNVIKCREVFKDIDWECQIFTKFQEQNYGCDPSEYIAQRWFFDHEEYGIVLEDDDVPAQSFFPFAKELLEKYKDDKRIAIICGMNNYDIATEIDESYFFSKRGSIWGWASWRRFIDLWDPEYMWLENRDKVESIQLYCDDGLDFKKYLDVVRKHQKTGKAHYESIMFAAAAQNNMLNIVPKYNMISNIGIDKESTHSVSDLRLLPLKTQRLFYKKTFEIAFPLVHPKVVEKNIAFDRKFLKRNYHYVFDKIEVGIRRILYSKRLFRR